MLFSALKCKRSCITAPLDVLQRHSFTRRFVAQLSSLVLAEHRNGSLSAATVNTVTAAAELGGDTSVLVAGKGISIVAEAAQRTRGVSKVLTAEDARLEHHLAEPLSLLLAAVQQRRNFSHILAPSSTFGRNVLPRAAALLGVQPLSDVTKVIDADTFVRPMYAGNASQTVKLLGPLPRMFTVRTTAFDAAGSNPDAAALEAVSLEELQAVQDCDIGTVWAGEQVRLAERPDLGSAKVVVSGGRALKSAEGFAMLERLADRLGGAVGASRAAVDAGYVPNDLQPSFFARPYIQVGQTGKVVAPRLYIAVGISGAIQHLAGMTDSGTIVAINTDPDAPIFQVADYGLVADLFEAVPQLLVALNNQCS